MFRDVFHLYYVDFECSDVKSESFLACLIGGDCTEGEYEILSVQMDTHRWVLIAYELL